MKWRVAFVTVVPSPYQRDLFHALAVRPEVELSVFYMEAAAPDSPWPAESLGLHEKILPGFWLPIGSARCHLNWSLPDPRNFDVIVVNTVMSFTGQWLMRKKLRAVRWVFWGERLNRGGLMHRFLSAPLHRAAGIAAIGSVAQRDYTARFPEPSSFCIPYFCDLAPFLAVKRPPTKPKTMTFLFCGQMIARKGVDLLLEALCQVENARVLLVGREADLSKLLSRVPTEVQRRVEYAGFQPPKELPRFFAAADVFVLPSRYDGWGVVVNQALGAGMPILCSDMVGAAHDLVQDEVNGTVFPAGDAASLARKLQRFVDHPELIEKWGAASRAKAIAWTPEVGAQKWVEALAIIVAR